MLHILWLVIKWIGIVLAALLLLLLFAAVLILFCPLRYWIRLGKATEEWEIHCRVSWLFGLVRANVRKGNDGSGIEVRICGIQPSALKKRLSQKKAPGKPKLSPELSEKRQSREGKRRAEGKKQQAVEEQPALPGGEEKAPEPGRAADLQPLKNVGQAEGENSGESPGSLKDEKEKNSGRHFGKRKNPLKVLWIRISGICRGIWNAIRSFIFAIRSACGKISLWKGFLGESQTKSAFSLIWRQLFRLLRHVGPQKWEGTVKFGLGDPAATGQALAILGAAIPLYGGNLSVTPVWDRKVLEGTASVKGRIYVARLLGIAARLYFDKDVKYVLKWIRQQGSPGK